MNTAIDTKIEDNYPTRNDDKTTVIDRPDPVVYGWDLEGPLTREDLQSFDKTGYLSIDQLLTPEELQECRDELERLANDPASKDDEATITEAQSNEVRSIFNVHRTNEIFKKLANDPRIVRRLEQILGSQVYVHQSRINYKPGFVGKDFWWHSDFESWHAEDGLPSPRAASISISLTDNYSFNGPLMIMPGSHKKYISCAGGTPEENYKQSLVMQGAGVPDKDTLTEFADEYGIDVLEGPAGGAVILDRKSTRLNSSDVTPYSRSNIFLVYNSVDNAAQEPFGAPSTRPEFIRSTDFTPAG